MLKSEMQHQYWITKKAVQQKLGAKEDKCIISSDAELDSRIEVFKSISETSIELSKIIDQYQERICIVSQEECVFGRFLREAGKRSKTTGPNITNTGKAISYCGQQRMCVRVPLLRLQHEVDVFRCRAVRDTNVTIQNMEKERTEYRAALSWMKSASSELDPDSAKSLDNFRVAQSHVRAAKQVFDGISMDSIQKIDLLAASRCNMFSHALVSYMTELKQFSQKCASTFDAISKSLLQKRKYDFTVLKELTQNEGNPNETIKEITTVDKDQELFFTDDFDDDKKNETVGGTVQNIENNKTTSTAATATTKPSNELEEELENILISLPPESQDPILNIENETSRNLLSNDIIELTTTTTNFNNKPISSIGLSTDLEKNITAAASSTTNSKANSPRNKQNKNLKDNKTSSTNSWLDLFADLDPLAKPEAFDLRLNAGNNNSQQT